MEFKSVRVSIFSAVLFGVATVVQAAPITLTDSYSANGNTVSGTLHGDWTGDVITLNNAAPLSSLSVKLANPAPSPLPNSNMGQGCLLYDCTTTTHLNGSVNISYDTWNFDLTGGIDFGTGIGNLTGDPKGTGRIGALSATSTPSFTVTAAQDYGVVNQALANAEAAAAEAALNVANVTINIDGDGYWNSIDLPNISAILNESGGTATLDLAIADAVLRGYFDYEVDINFSNSVVNYVGGAFFNFLEGIIYNQITSVMIDQIEEMGFSATGGDNSYGFDCEGTRGSVRGRINVECTADFNMQLSGALPASPALISAPAMTGIFTLSLLGLMAARRRRVIG